VYWPPVSELSGGQYLTGGRAVSSYGFRCRKCKSEFELLDLNLETYKEAFCVECRSETLELISYDDSENSFLVWIASELQRLNNGQRKILDLLEKKPKRKPGALN
jgi:DNA-directed RNA polymerase subunit RPC12/RpoP